MSEEIAPTFVRLVFCCTSGTSPGLSRAVHFAVLPVFHPEDSRTHRRLCRIPPAFSPLRVCCLSLQQFLWKPILNSVCRRCACSSRRRNKCCFFLADDPITNFIAPFTSRKLTCHCLYKTYTADVHDFQRHSIKFCMNSYFVS